MIDYFFRWASEDAAWADRMRLAEWLGIDPNATSWNQSTMLPNVKAWRPSQSTVVNGVVQRVYLAGWFAIIASPARVPVLLNDGNLQFCLDRVAWNTQVPPYVIKNNIGAVINDVAVEPIFAGSNYPVNGYSP